MMCSGRRKNHPARLALMLVGSLLVASPSPASGNDDAKACSKAATYQWKACSAEILDDFYTRRAWCANEPEGVRECVQEARDDRSDAAEECVAQFDARKEFCEEFGEAPYAPDMDPALFQDPRHPLLANSHFPLAVGNRWVYEEDEERIEIEILDATKRIAGIDCIVYRDVVTSEGRLVEDTDDWFALRNDADVVYCGEEVKDYETFEGDDPEAPELVSIDGRFKAGVELAKAGIAFLGSPTEGAVYRQEWDPGNAEDFGKVLSTHYGYGLDAELDEFVPQELAELMCPDDDCVVIQDGSTLEPDAFERKYYARGIGKFLEVKPDEGEFVPLVECNFDLRCDSLPVGD